LGYIGFPAMVVRPAPAVGVCTWALTEKGCEMLRRLGVSMLVIVPTAMFLAVDAMAVTVPSIPVGAYGSALLAGLASAVTDVFPYAAAITAFAIGVGLIRRWLGAKKATSV